MHTGNVPCSGDFSIFGDGCLGLHEFLCHLGCGSLTIAALFLIGQFPFFVEEIGVRGGATSANSVFGPTHDRF